MDSTKKVIYLYVLFYGKLRSLKLFLILCVRVVQCGNSGVVQVKMSVKILVCMALGFIAVGCGGGGGKGVPETTPPDRNTSNSAPISRLEGSKSAYVGESVVLSANGSSDIDGDTLKYTWYLLSSPEAGISNVLLSSGYIPTYSVYPTLEGEYSYRVLVDDEKGGISASEIVVNVIEKHSAQKIELPSVGSSTLFKVSPFNPMIMFYGTTEEFVGQEGTGLFKSTDGGVAWKRINENVIDLLEISPIDEGMIIARQRNSLYSYIYSTDNGETWINGPEIRSNNQLASPSSIAFDYFDEKEWWLASFDNISGGIFRTKDGGASWERVVEPNYKHSYFSQVVTSRMNKDTVFAVSRLSDFEPILKSMDNGDSFYPIVNGLTTSKLNWISGIVIDGANDEFLVTEGHYSVNGGSNWSVGDYSAYGMIIADGVMYKAVSNGNSLEILKSSNYGQTWEVLVSNIFTIFEAPLSVGYIEKIDDYIYIWSGGLAFKINVLPRLKNS